MKLRWKDEAVQDLKGIHEYLEMFHSYDMARRTVVEIRTAIRSLKKFPGMGRPGQEPGTRELKHTKLPHIIVYRIVGDVIEVLRIWHPAQNRSKEYEVHVRFRIQ